MQSADLRPLTIGEIFDRAVTLLVRNWVPLLGIAGVQVLPVLALECLGTLTSQQDVISLGAAWGTLGGTVTTIATGAVIASIYRGNDAPVSRALAAGFKKLLPALWTQILIGIGTGVPMLLLGAVAFGMGAFRYANAYSAILDVIVLAIGVAWLCCMAMTSLYALTSMGIDKCGTADAIGKAGSLFTDGGLGRTVLFAIAITLLSFGGGMLGEGVRYAMQAYLHLALLGYAVHALIAFATSPLTDVSIAVYYFDMAIRREGYDMQVALDAMAS